MASSSVAAPVVSWGDDELRLTPDISVLVGADSGKYPSGNSVVVRGAGETIIIDPSVTVVASGGASVPIDAIVNSHAHEDHLAGNGLFPTARVHVHTEDYPGVASLEGLLDVYGLDGDTRASFATTIQDEFHFAPRPDAEGFSDGHVFDLGGITMEAVHLPAIRAVTAAFVSTAACSSCPISTSPASVLTTETPGRVSMILRKA